MRRWSTAVSLLFSCVTSVTGCVGLMPPEATVVRGPAIAKTPKRVLALPIRCGSLSRFTAADSASVCTPKLLADSSARVRSALELQGMSVVDAEHVNAEIRSRFEVHDRKVRTDESGRAPRLLEITSADTVTLEGARFEDAPPALQASLTSDLGIDAVLTSRAWVGSSGLGGRRTIRVQIRMLRIDSGELVWASRCDVEADLGSSDALAIERASTCAIDRVESR
jgi:hypothetical protein